MAKFQSKSKNVEDKRARTTGTKKTHRVTTEAGPYPPGNPFRDVAREAAGRTMNRQMQREGKNPFSEAMEKAAKSDKVKTQYRAAQDPSAQFENRKGSRPTKIDAKRRKALKYIQD